MLMSLIAEGFQQSKFGVFKCFFGLELNKEWSKP